jgi:hypothetical protein
MDKLVPHSRKFPVRVNRDRESSTVRKRAITGYQAKMCHIRETMAEMIPGDPVDVKVLREGQIVNLSSP